MSQKMCPKKGGSMFTCLDHDDGSDYYLDTRNVCVFAGMKNYIGQNKIWDSQVMTRKVQCAVPSMRVDAYMEQPCEWMRVVRAFTLNSVGLTSGTSSRTRMVPFPKTAAEWGEHNTLRIVYI